MSYLSKSTYDTDSDSDIDDNDTPPNWEERVNEKGCIYYANHLTKQTQWFHPNNGNRYYVMKELPFGWTSEFDEAKKRAQFINISTGNRTYTDPRLAYPRTVDNSSAIPTLPVVQRFDSCSTGSSVLRGVDLSDIYAIVTGANSGIGLHTTKYLAEHGAYVTMLCRDSNTGQEQANKLQANTKLQLKIRVMQCDLSSLENVCTFVVNYLSLNIPLHILILNAAIFSAPHKVTVDGFESTFQINFLAQALLALKLQKKMVESKPARIVFVSSESHRFAPYLDDPLSIEQLSYGPLNYSPMIAYNTSKFCMNLLSISLNSKLEDQGVTVNVVHPGNMIASGLSRNWWFWRVMFFVLRPFTKSLDQASATTLYVATHKELQGLGGLYFVNCWSTYPSQHSQVVATQDNLYDFTVHLLNKSLSSFTNCHSDGTVLI